MEIEVEHLKAEMTTERTVERAGMKFFEGKIGSTDVVVVQCGVGKVNAAACVQILCDCFEVTHVINTGVAGSMDADIDIGDIVVQRMPSTMTLTSHRSDIRSARSRASEP